jgi:hypothetical protein
MPKLRSIKFSQGGADCYTPGGEPWYYHQECQWPFACCRTLDLCLDKLVDGEEGRVRVHH